MPDEVIIGKNIIEILTTGMYENPLVIYREYIQNSVDAINQAVELEILEEPRDGEIHIQIDAEKKRISFDDNAIGIRSNQAWNILTSIAASTKDRNKHLGFRGIGRLAGLAYCENLVIETSFRGEPCKTSLTWDGDKLKSILSNQKENPSAEELIKSITTFRDDLKENEEEHYFRVELKNVKNLKLLIVENVEKYLRMVAPVPFQNHFIYGKSILDGLKDRGVNFGEYRIFVNMREVFKPFRPNVYKEDKKSEKQIDEIIDIEFSEFTSNDELLAVGWYGITKSMHLIPAYNEPVGIRFRKGNIQIGGEFTFQKFFKDQRFHRYFVGEIHVVSNKLLPNGQRDYFDESYTLTLFESQMYNFTQKLSKLCKDVSDLNSATNKIDDFVKKKNEYITKEENQEFVSPVHEEKEKNKLEKAEEKAEEGKRDFTKIEKKAEEDEALKKIIRHRKKDLEKIGKNEKTIDESNINKNKKQYKSNKLSKLTKKEQKLIGEIYEVITTILPPDLSNVLIYKIEEKFGGKKNCTQEN